MKIQENIPCRFLEILGDCSYMPHPVELSVKYLVDDLFLSK